MCNYPVSQPKREGKEGKHRPRTSAYCTNSTYKKKHDNRDDSPQASLLDDIFVFHLRIILRLSFGLCICIVVFHTCISFVSRNNPKPFSQRPSRFSADCFSLAKAMPIGNQPTQVMLRYYSLTFFVHLPDIFCHLPLFSRHSPCQQNKIPSPLQNAKGAAHFQQAAPFR